MSNLELTYGPEQYLPHTKLGQFLQLYHKQATPGQFCPIIYHGTSPTSLFPTNKKDTLECK